MADLITEANKLFAAATPEELDTWGQQNYRPLIVRQSDIPDGALQCDQTIRNDWQMRLVVRRSYASFGDVDPEVKICMVLLPKSARTHALWRDAKIALLAENGFDDVSANAYLSARTPHKWDDSTLAVVSLLWCELKTYTKELVNTFCDSLGSASTLKEFRAVLERFFDPELDFQNNTVVTRASKKCREHAVELLAAINAVR